MTAQRVLKAMVGLPPDFLSNFLALASFMRLSVLKAAHTNMFGAAYRKSGSAPSFSAHVRFGERGAPVGIRLGQKRRDLWYPTSREKRARCGVPVFGAGTELTKHMVVAGQSSGSEEETKQCSWQGESLE